MKIRNSCYVFAITALFAQVGFASPAVWTSFSNTTATGVVAGVGIRATTVSTAPFDETETHRFSSGWDAAPIFQLGSTEALGLRTRMVNGEDAQRFDFDSPWSDGLFYIENFDSGSIATIMVSGGASIDLLSGSASITYVPIGASLGTLRTSNEGFNGEGDAVFQLTGPVESISIEYSRGLQANGIFYTFAGGQSVVPEPASLLIWGMFAALGVTMRWRWSKSRSQ